MWYHPLPMREISVNETTDQAAHALASGRYLPFLLVLFVGSGCSALIYEIVWFQLLELVIGSSTISLGILLGTFMGGMCLGSWLLPRFVSRTHHPLRVYAFMELGIGLIGLAIFFGMPLLGGLYLAWAGSGFYGMLFRGIVAGVCLLPPTLLMGATLPAISRWVETTPAGVSWLGFFYGGNIGGAVIGSLLTGPRVALAWCQMLLCAAIAWAAYMLMQSLPNWPIDPSLTGDPWVNMQLDLVRSLWAVLPAAILWGASFPLALASLASRGQDPARLVAGVYAANTVGAIVGSLGASLLLVAWLGSQQSQQLLIIISATSAVLALVPATFDAESSKGKSSVALAIFLVLAAGFTVLLARRIPELPARLVEYGRFAAMRGAQNKTIYVGEGLTASVAVSDLPDGIRNYHNAGKVQASSDPADMKLQRMLGHLTTLVPQNPRSVLVIGCGAGVTAGAVSIEPKLEHETIVEIEPLVPRVVSTYFAEHNFDVVKNPKVEIRVDDGRHYLLTSREKFDGITSDTLDT